MRTMFTLGIITDMIYLPVHKGLGFKTAGVGSIWRIPSEVVPSSCMIRFITVAF